MRQVLGSAVQHLLYVHACLLLLPLFANPKLTCLCHLSPRGVPVQQEDKCRFTVKKEKAEVTGYTDIDSGNEDKLKEALATVGPVSVAIDASHPSFQMYAGGESMHKAV